MRNVMLALVAVLAFSTVVEGANPGRRIYGPYGVRSNGTWQKGYGPSGYGWYNSYGDYVGNDGYSSIRLGIRGNSNQTPGYPAPPYGYGRAHNFGY
jgi:hypothetical protein